MKNLVLLIILALASSIAFGQSQQKIGTDRLILGTSSVYDTELDLSGSIIRRNKTSGKTEFSNDGTNFTPFVTAPGINPNYIINGNFDIWQRNTTFSLSSIYNYTADRWAMSLVGETASVSRQATTGSEAFNAQYFHRTTNTSTTGASNMTLNQQKIEQLRRFSGKTVTLSFYMKADTARNITVEFVQNFGTNGSPSAQVDGISMQKLALTTSWQKFTIIANIPTVSGKVFGSNNNDYLGLNFWYSAGSNFNARTDSLGQQSGTFDLAQIKLEEGSEATEFVLAGRTLAGEIISCQRFYELSTFNRPDGGAQGYTYIVPLNIVSGAHASYGGTIFNAVKRAVPSMTLYGLDGIGTAANTVSISGVARSAAAEGISVSGFRRITNTSGVTWNQSLELGYNWVADAEL